MALFANFLQRLAEALGTECIAELGIKLSAGFYTNVFKIPKLIFLMKNNMVYTMRFFDM